MTKSQQLWLRAARLLSDPGFFDAERERVLAAYPLLNAHGLGQVRRRRRIFSAESTHLERWEIECIPADLDAARDALRAGGQDERGIRNTLEYFVEGRVSLSYRLKGCGWARRFNGPAPPKRSSYALKHEVESYLREMDRCRGHDGEAARSDRATSNGAFICAALMAGLRMWSYQDSVNPDLRLGKPWVVAGLQPEDYSQPDDTRMARFWRWVVQQDTSDPHIEQFIADTVDLLYSGADLRQLHEAAARRGSEAREAYDRLRREFGFALPDGTLSSRLGFMAGHIQVPDDFDSMGGPEIEKMFGEVLSACSRRFTMTPSTASSSPKRRLRISPC